MFTTTFRDTCLTQFGATSYIGLIKGITDWRAGTVTEATYGGYGNRVLATWSTKGVTTPAGGRQMSNTGAVTFPQNSTGNEDEIAFGVYSAITGGTLYAIGLLDTRPPLFATVDTGGLTSELLVCPAHGLSTDHRVFILAAPGAPIPTGLSENTAYFVKSAGLTTDAFALATTSGGAAVNITASGACLVCPYAAVTVATLATPEFAIGALVLQI